MLFHDITIIAGGRTSARQHDSATLVRGAVEVFRDLLERHGDNFRRPVPVKAFSHIQLQWTREKPGAALATFWVGQVPLTISALASGRDVDADREALQGLHQLMLKLFAGSPVEPGFDLLSAAERPLIVSAVLPQPPSLANDLAVIADMETCLAAAFFESAEANP